jgi:predicted enzyme related to lactoylglutathione lyase
MAEHRFSGMGKFVWQDLVTTDVPKAIDYYGRLFGWTTEEWDMGPAGKYQMIRAGNTDIGGFVNPGAGQKAPSHWLGYVVVDDVDKAAERTASAGGAVVVQPTDIPNVGRFAVVRDPQGAHVMPFTSLSAGEVEPDHPAPGTFVWNELHTTNPEAAAEFYRVLFGWSTRVMDMGDHGKYWIFVRNGKDAAGMMKMPPASPAPPNWLPYVGVENVDATAVKVKQLGGTLHVPPMDIPNIGRFAVAADVVGAVLGIYKSASG